MQAPSGAGFERVLKQFSLSARPENEARSGDLLCRCCDDNLPVWSADVRVRKTVSFAFSLILSFLLIVFDFGQS